MLRCPVDFMDKRWWYPFLVDCKAELLPKQRNKGTKGTTEQRKKRLPKLTLKIWFKSKPIRTMGCLSERFFFPQLQQLLCMDEIRSHHLKTIIETIGIYVGKSSFQGFLAGANGFRNHPQYVETRPTFSRRVSSKRP